MRKHTHTHTRVNTRKHTHMHTRVNFSTQTWMTNKPFYIPKEGRKCFVNHALSTFYLRLYGVTHMVKDHQIARERERNVLFNDALNTFYLQLYGITHMVKDHSDSKRGNPLPPT